MPLLTRKRCIAFCTLLFLTRSLLAGPTVIPEVNSRVKKSVNNSSREHVQTTHITRKEITESPVTNLTELLQQSQSIVRLTNNSGDSNQTALSIRGFGDNASANTLILIDGFPLANPTLLAPNFNLIALSDIERIDITQGSLGTRYGNSAVGGVMNIITRHPSKFNAESIVGIGSFNKQFYNTFIANKLSNGYFFKGFGYRSLSDNYRRHNQQTDNTVSMQLGRDYEKGTTSLNLQAYENSIQFPGGLTLAQYRANPRQAVNFINRTHYRTYIYQLLNKQAFTNDWLLETRISHRDVNGAGIVSIAFERDEWVNNINPELIGNIRGNKIVAGYVFQNTYFRLDNTKVHNRVTTKENDIYAQITIPVISQLDFTLGSRLAIQNNNAEKIIGQSIYSTNRVLVTEQGLMYKLNNEWQFFLRRDGDFSFPKANEQTWTPTGTTKLAAQTGTSYEAGTEMTTDRQTMQVNIYRLQLQDEIAFNATQTADLPFGSFSNFDSTLRRGITVTEKIMITQKITFDTQANYVDPRFDSGINSGKQIPAVPKINGNIGLHYQFLPHWQTQYAAIYTGKRYASDDLANVNGQLPGYWLHTIALKYQQPSYDANIEVANLFNQTYSAYTMYNAGSHTNTYYPGAGRSYLFTLKVNLD